MEWYPPYAERMEGILIWGDKELEAEKAVYTNFVTSSLICYPKQKTLCFVKSSQIIDYLSKKEHKEPALVTF